VKVSFRSYTSPIVVDRSRLILHWKDGTLRVNHVIFGKMINMVTAYRNDSSHKALIGSIMTYTYPSWEFMADIYLLKLQCLQNKVLYSTSNFPRCITTYELHVAFNIPYIYDFITTLCKHKPTLQSVDWQEALYMLLYVWHIVKLNSLIKVDIAVNVKCQHDKHVLLSERRPHDKYNHNGPTPKT